VDLALREQPDLVLMDLGLPVIDGHEAIRLLRATPSTRDIPVIALTAHALDADREQAREAGCDAFETKPVVLSRLVARIEALLGPGRPQAGPPPGPATSKEAE
jgi:CheY-like chemotaxis protein